MRPPLSHMGSSRKDPRARGPIRGSHRPWGRTHGSAFRPDEREPGGGTWGPGLGGGDDAPPRARTWGRADTREEVLPNTKDPQPLPAWGPAGPAPLRPDFGQARAWGHFSLAGILNLAGFLFQFYALLLAGVSITVPLVSTAPFFALLLSYFLLRDMERVTAWKVAGTVLIVLGAGLIAFQIE